MIIFFISAIVLMTYNIMMILDYALSMKYEVIHPKIILGEEDPTLVNREREIRKLNTFFFTVFGFLIISIIANISLYFRKSK